MHKISLEKVQLCAHQDASFISSTAWDTGLLEQCGDGGNSTLVEEVPTVSLRLKTKKVFFHATALTIAPKPREKNNSEIFLLVSNLRRPGSQAATKTTPRSTLPLPSSDNSNRDTVLVLSHLIEEN